MASRNLVCAFVAFWWVLGAFLLIASVETVVSSFARGRGGVEVHAVIIGTIEAIAALLFLVPRTMRVGGMGLLFALAVAVLVHSARGQFPGPLLVYGAGVFFLVVHGPVSTPLFRSKPRERAV